MRQTMQTLIQRYVAKGFSVIPIQGGSKEPCISWKTYQERKPTQEELRQFFLTDHERNVAIITGGISEITVVDIDNVAEITLSNQEREKRRKIIDIIESINTMKVRTPRGGIHAYFLYTDRIRTGPVGNLKIDVKNDGGYVLAPPSYTQRGEYVFLADTDITEMPEELIQAIIEARKDTFTMNIQTQTESCMVIREGMRNSYLASIAGSLRRRGIQQEEIFQTLLLINERYCQPVLPEKEVAAIAKSISRYEPEILQTEQVEEARTTENTSTEEADNAKNTEENEIDKIINTYTYCHLELRDNLEELELVEGLLFKNSIAVLSGMGSVGKTTLLHQLALCLASGQDFLSLRTKKSTVLYLNAEETRASLGGIDQKIRQKLQIEEKISNYIHIFLDELGYLDCQFFHLTTYPPGVEVTQFASIMQSICHKFMPDVVIIDPIAYFMKIENDNAYVSTLYRLLKKLMPQSCIVLAHHLSKTSINDGSTNTRTKARGAIAITENSKTHLLLERGKLYVDKCNYNPSMQGATLHLAYDGIFKLQHVTMPVSHCSNGRRSCIPEDDPF